MKARNILGVIIGIPLMIAVGVGLFSCGQQNPPTPAPTPAPLPANPAGWINGFLTGQIPVPASLLAPGTVKAKIAYDDCGSFEVESNKDAATVAALVAFAESCGKESDLPQMLEKLGYKNVPILFKSPAKKAVTGEIHTTAGGDCFVKGTEDLARECLNFSANVFWNSRPPEPPGSTPLPEEIGLELKGEFIYDVTAYRGGRVISFKKISPAGNVYAKDVYTNDQIDRFCGIQILGEKYDTLRISYNCEEISKGKVISTFREWKLAELFP